MNELKDVLERTVGSIEPTDATSLHSVTIRARRRKLVSRGLTVVTALCVFAVPVALLAVSVGRDDHGSRAPSTSSNQPKLLTYQGRVREEALARGILIMDPSGCTYLEHDSGRRLIAWPSGTYSASDAEGGLVVISEDGYTLALEGQRLTVSGGNVGIDEGGAFADLLPEIEACGQRNAFLVGEVEEAVE
jgi:hypothetical protein